MTMPPAGYAIAAITVMLWIMWSDTLRARRPSPILYTIRIALFLIVSGVLVHNLVRYPEVFAGGGQAFAILAVLAGIAGAAYFAGRLVRRT